MNEKDQQLIKITPSERQIKHQQLEFYGFIHFTINTFTYKEWGEGTEDIRIFNPIHMDANQWVKSIKAAGMKGVILTCKHHDGFCLWPTKYTQHSIQNTPYKNGTGDIVKEVSKACKRENIKFGIYLSPWDRNNKTYGYGETYNDYFINQLTELLSNYGEIFSVWFDGACGEGDNGLKLIYDWERYYACIRKLQPSACITVCGPDIRWCGNEAGDTRINEWSVVPNRLTKAEIIQENSQQSDDESFREKKIKSTDMDLGSRLALKQEEDLIWYPAEVNTSIRPGWFYHQHEDEQVKSLQDLMDIYYRSVGGNATFLLNIPPTKEGLIHKNDVIRLEEMGDRLKKEFAYNLIEKAKIHADFEDENNKIDFVKEDSYDLYFKTTDGVTSCDITIELPQKTKISRLVLKENIKLSQRIEEYEIVIEDEAGDKVVYKGNTVGYKKIICLSDVITKNIKIKILDARISPTLAFVGIY